MSGRIFVFMPSADIEIARTSVDVHDSTPVRPPLPRRPPAALAQLVLFQLGRLALAAASSTLGTASAACAPPPRRRAAALCVAQKVQAAIAPGDLSSMLGGARRRRCDVPGCLDHADLRRLSIKKEKMKERACRRTARSTTGPSASPDMRTTSALKVHGWGGEYYI